MATLTMTPTEQLNALSGSGITYPANLADESARSYDGRRVVNELRTLIPMLRKAGIVPSDAAKLDELRAVKYTAPAQPARFLDLTADDLSAYIRDSSLHKVTESANSGFFGLASQVESRLGTEALASMREEADQYVEMLRPAYAAALEPFKSAAALGLTALSTPEQAMQQGGEAVALWLQLTQQKGAADILDSIAALRIRISLILGVEPYAASNHGWGGDQKPINYSPCFGGTFDQVERSGALVVNGWKRWITVAAGSGILATPTEVAATTT